MFEFILKLFDSLPTILLIFFRISSFFIVAPIFSSRTLPMRIKTTLAGMLTIMVFPFMPTVVMPEIMSLAMILLVLKQIFIGILAGYVFKVVFEIILYAANVIALQSGLGFAVLSDPQSGMTVPAFSQIYYLSAMLVFLVLNGHVMMLSLFLQTFQVMPLSGLIGFNVDLSALFTFTGLIFSMALSITIPLVIALLCVNLIFAVITRSAPQLNIFAIGFPVLILLSFVILFISFPNTMGQFRDVFESGFMFFHQLMRLP